MMAGDDERTPLAMKIEFATVGILIVLSLLSAVASFF
jgi:hypothetical protein